MEGFAVPSLTTRPPDRANGGGPCIGRRPGPVKPPKTVEAVKAGELQYTVLQPVAVFAEEAVRQADNFIKNGTTGVDTEKQLFDCLLITVDNVDNYTGPFVLEQ